MMLNRDVFIRTDARAADTLRPVEITRRFTKYAEGSVLMCAGDTHVLCTASVTVGVPNFLRGKGEGWVTAEYGLLPRSTGTRTDREAARGKQTGRTQEIQRLIGRSLRAVVDRKSSANIRFRSTVMCCRPTAARAALRLQAPGLPFAMPWIGCSPRA